MTQQDIQERNKQIALMLGWKYCHKDLVFTSKPTPAVPDGSVSVFSGWIKNEQPYIKGVPLIVVKENRQQIEYLRKLTFHSDWNSLMKAVEFIEKKEYWVEIVKSELGTKTRNYPIIWCEIGKENNTDLLDNNNYTKITRGESVNRDKKKAIFIAVSDFAQLYNEGKL